LSKNVAKFKGFETTPTDQNCMHEEIKTMMFIGPCIIVIVEE